MTDQVIPHNAAAVEIWNGNIGLSNSAITIAKYHNGLARDTGPQPSVTITAQA